MRICFLRAPSVAELATIKSFKYYCTLQGALEGRHYSYSRFADKKRSRPSRMGWDEGSSLQQGTSWAVEQFSLLNNVFTVHPLGVSCSGSGSWSRHQVASPLGTTRGRGAEAVLCPREAESLSPRDGDSRICGARNQDP